MTAEEAHDDVGAERQPSAVCIGIIPMPGSKADSGIEQLRHEVNDLRAEVAWISDHVVGRLNALNAQVDGLRAELSR